ncbi:MAG: SCO6880 family protein, partial [Acidimicrobiia bacterium]
PLVEWTPHALRWAAQRRARTWFAPLPTLSGPAPATPPLPPPLDAQVVTAVPGPGGAEMAVVADRVAGTLAATLRVAGRQFALVERADQDALLALWGDALGAFCREAAAVVEVRWSEWAAPAGMEDTHAYLAEHALDDPTDPAVASYRQLLRSAAPVATRHEVLITVVVSTKRVRVEARHDGDRAAAATEVLAEEVRRLARRLEAAGLSVSEPLNPAELARALRVRLDPTALATLDRRARSLGERAGVVAPASAGPLCATAGRRWWEVDGSLHRAFALTEWPRAEVGPTWMADLLLYAGGVRTIAVSYTPVPPRASQRAIARQAARLEADVDQRRRSGFRVGAHHRRASAAVEEREEELVAGFAELAYAGVVDVCAPDAEALERACADVVQAAAACGIELRPLDRRHDQGAAACLPLAYGLAPRLVAG